MSYEFVDYAMLDKLSYEQFVIQKNALAARERRKTRY